MQRAEAEERNLSKEETDDQLIKKRVKAGVASRVKEANSQDQNNWSTLYGS